MISPQAGMPAPGMLVFSIPNTAYCIHLSPFLMIESLLPLLFLPFSQTLEPAMVPAHTHSPVQWEQSMPMMDEMPRQRVRRFHPQMQTTRMRRERPAEIRHKGYQPTEENYFTKRLEHAVQTNNPQFPTSDLSQRTHREWVRTNRRMDRGCGDLPEDVRFRAESKGNHSIAPCTPSGTRIPSNS